MTQYDLIVIGAGRASNLAANAGKRGLKVAIIEKAELGGTCPNKGCVPSKLLIGHASVIRNIQESNLHYIDSTINKIDIKKIFEKVNSYISKVDGNYEKKFNENVTIYKGTASFVSNKIIEINSEKITAKNIVIATGTRPADPQHEKAWTSDDIFPLDLNKIPNSISIVGAGVIACELANFFDAIGIETTMIVRGVELLSKEDKEIKDIFKSEFTKNVKVLFETDIEKVEHLNDEFILSLNTNEKTSIHKSQALLYAIGRKSNADLLKLENTDIKVNKRGFIIRDEFFQTDVKDVFVVGDASGETGLQHAAAYEINYLEKILYENQKEPLKFKYMPHGVFTHPEVASVGMTEEEAIKSNINYIAHSSGWKASAKAMSLKIDYPLCKFIVNPDTYEILGCHLIGYESVTMMHQVLSIMHLENDIRHLKEMLYIHPALNEALLVASVQTIKKIEESKSK